MGNVYMKTPVSLDAYFNDYRYAEGDDEDVFHAALHHIDDAVKIVQDACDKDVLRVQVFNNERISSEPQTLIGVVAGDDRSYKFRFDGRQAKLDHCDGEDLDVVNIFIAIWDKMYDSFEEFLRREAQEFMANMQLEIKEETKA